MLYLARTVDDRRGAYGTGWTAEYMPAGYEEANFQAAAIDLRPDASKPDGWWLLRTPARLPRRTQGVHLLGDDLDDMSDSALKHLSGKLALPLGLTTIRDHIVELLVRHGDHNNPRRWNPVTESRFLLRTDEHGRHWPGSRLEIWLGELIWSQVCVRGGAVPSFTETFTIADQAAIAGDQPWTETLQGSIWSIVSNKAHLTGNLGLFGLARCDTDLTTSNHFTICAVTWQASTGRLGPTTRGNSSNSDCYLHAGTAASDLDELSKVISGTRTTLPSGTQAHTINAGSSAVTGTSNGSSISVLIGAGSTLTVTDTSITTGTRIGIGASSASSANAAGDVDTMTAADLVATISATDTGLSSDATAPVLAVTLPGSDSGSGAEGTPALATTLAGSDTGSGTEGAPLVALSAAPDTGSGAEGAPTVAVALPGSDTGTGGEGNPTIRLSTSDVGSGAEGTPALTAAVTGSDQSLSLEELGPWDDFNRPDNASSMGTSPSGHVWTTRSQILGIQGGQAGPTTINSGNAVATVDVASVDTSLSTYASGLFAQQAGLVARWIDSDNYYFAMLGSNGASSQIVSRAGGVETQLAVDSTQWSPGDLFTFSVVGRSLKVFKNGVFVYGITDSSISTGTKAGIISGHVNNRFSRFYVQYLSVLSVVTSSTDVGSGTEAAPSLVTAVSGADTDTAAENAPTVTAAIPATDSGTGGEGNPALAVILAVADTGSGGEGGLSLAAAVSGADIDTAAEDAPMVTATIPGSDSGSGTEGDPALALATSDIGSSSEAVPVVAAELSTIDLGSSIESGQSIDIGGGIVTVGDVDTASTSETATAITAQLATTDLSASTDSSSALAVLLSSNDAASSLETVAALAVALAALDVGVTAETAALVLAILAAADATTSSDSDATTIGIGGNDTTTGAETGASLAASLTGQDTASAVEGTPLVGLGDGDTSVSVETLTTIVAALVLIECIHQAVRIFGVAQAIGLVQLAQHIDVIDVNQTIGSCDPEVLV